MIPPPPARFLFPPMFIYGTQIQECHVLGGKVPNDDVARTMTCIHHQNA